MNTNDHLLNIMRHLDGEIKTQPADSMKADIEELKNTLAALKALPWQEPDPATDIHIIDFIKDLKNRRNTPVFLTFWKPITLIAASLALTLYLALPAKLSERYNAISSNPEKISFIYALNETTIEQEELSWLLSLLDVEQHPNIRVTLIDLIENKGYKVPVEFTGHLVEEPVPAVQMAFLNVIEQQYASEMESNLLAFSAREDLDQEVRKRLTEILIEK